VGSEEGAGAGAACWAAAEEAGLAGSEYMDGISMAYGYRLVKGFVWNVEGCNKALSGRGLGV
jgi:hypothetical protein